MDHIKAKPPATFYCERCGSHYAMALPAPATLISAASSAFLKDHASCKLTERGTVCSCCLQFGHAAIDCPSLKYNGDHHAWWNGGDSGLSAKTICATLLGWKGIGDHVWDYYPHDAHDFGRCYRFLKAFPELHARIGEMSKVPGWERLAASWDQLERYYEQDLASGDLSSTNAIIKSLIE